jgi:hypothetical protein
MAPAAKRSVICILGVLLLAALACALPQGEAPTPTTAISPIPSSQAGSTTNSPAAAASPTSAATTPTTHPTPPPPVAEQRIAIHRIYGIARLYDRTSQASFTPRGVNYAILVPALDYYEDRTLAAGFYNHQRTQADFQTLSAMGYNTLRIIVDGCTSGDSCIGLQDGEGLNPAYLDNLTDLLNLARDNHLFVLLVSSGLPDLGGYAALANRGSTSSFALYRNTQILTQAGVQASQKYWADLLVGLAVRQAPFDIILGWELLGEGYYEYDQPPFTLHSGTVSTANGKTYDMYIVAQKSAMALDGMRYYISQLRQTILAYDPTALITMGFVAPNSPNAWRDGDQRQVDTAGLLSNSALDFFDLHTSPGSGLSLAEAAQNFGLGAHVDKPVLMGSVGASTWSYPQASDGAIAVQDWIAASCQQGFSGWLYNGYYPSPAGLLDATWGFVDEHNALLNALAPVKQPDVCTITVLPGRNLALGKVVSASGALPDQATEMAVDGDPNTQWSAGAFPPQWIEIDLGAAYDIGEIRLTVGQWPAGDTVHQLWVGASRDSLRQVHEFSGSEFDYDVLSYAPATPLRGIRYVRVATTESPSWVSWREIEVLAPFPATPTPAVINTPPGTPTATPE